MGYLRGGYVEGLKGYNEGYDDAREMWRER